MIGEAEQRKLHTDIKWNLRFKETISFASANGMASRVACLYVPF